MPGIKRGLILLVTLLGLWAAAGHVFHRVDAAHDELEYRLVADLIVHKRELVAETPNPRVIIAGGSNAYYGIDSDVLAKRLDVMVVNFAFPFGAYHHRINLALLEQVVRPSDVVVYASASFWVEDGDDEVRRQALGFNSYLVQRNLAGYEDQFDRTRLAWKPLPRTNSLLLAMINSLLPREARPWTVDTDAHGDYTGCVPAPVVEPLERDKGGDRPALASVMRHAAQRLKKQDIRLLVHMPWLFIHEDERDEWIELRRRFVRQYEPVVPVIASAPSMVLRSDRDDFCDSSFHLSRKATERRSERLAKALEAYVKDI